MKKLVIVWILIAVIVVTGAYFLTRPSAKTNDHDNHEHETSQVTAPQVDLTAQTEVTMDIKDFAYTQPNIKIKKGTKVTWTNRDSMQHNVMKEHEGEEHAHDAPTKDEIVDDVFAGPLLATGESYSFTFNEVGDINYHCAPHPYMQGKVTVVE